MKMDSLDLGVRNEFQMEWSQSNTGNEINISEKNIEFIDTMNTRTGLNYNQRNQGKCDGEYNLLESIISEIVAIKEEPPEIFDETPIEPSLLPNEIHDVPFLSVDPIKIEEIKVEPLELTEEINTQFSDGQNSDNESYTFEMFLENFCVFDNQIENATENEIDDKQKYFKCHNCDQKFVSRGKRERHERIHSGAAKLFQCRFCDEHFAQFNDRQDHEQIHRDKMNFKCPYCYKLFSDHSTCIRHKKKNCKYRPTIPELVKSVINIRKEADSTPFLDAELMPSDGDEEKSFKCSFCDKYFGLKRNRRIHELIHSNQRNYQCPYCSKLFHSQSSCIRHTKRVCDLRPTDPNQIKKVINIRKSLRNIKPNEVNNPKNEVETFKCCYCLQQFNSRDECREHKQLHANQKKPFKCNFCDKHFSMSRNRRVHEMIHENERNFQCPYCLNLFNCQSSCIRHTNYRCASRPSDPRQIKKVIDLRKVNASANGSNQLEQSDQTMDFPANLDLDSQELPISNDVAIEPNFLNFGAHVSTCSYCSETFNSMDECKQHKKMHANEERPYKCRLCDKFFRKSWNRRIHEVTHTNQAYFQCPYCQKMFHSQSSSIRHTKRKCQSRPTDSTQIKNVIDIRKVNKEISRENNEIFASQESTSSNSKLLDEISVPELFKWSQCLQAFDSKEECNEHEKVHKYSDKTFKCSFCDKYFRLASNRRIHELTHSSERHFQCPYCLHRFNSQSSCIRHTNYRCLSRPNDPKKVKKVIDLRKVNDSADDSYQLEQSDQTMGLDADFDIKPQLPISNGAAVDLHELKLNPNSNDAIVSTQVCTCSYCSETFNSMDECNQHKKVHAYEERPYKCRLCDKFFRFSNNRNIHELTHNTQSFFKCPYCFKLFHSHSSGSRHTKRKCPLRPTDPKQIKKVIDIRKSASTLDNSHNVENPVNEVETFKCFCCSERFESKEECKEHEQIHEDPNKPFKCRLCDKFFRFSTNRNIHELTHNSESFFKCPYCFKLFHSHSSGNRHTKRKCPLRPTDPALIKKVIDIRKVNGTKDECSEHEKVQKYSDKPFKCSFCDKHFRLASNRRIHELTHSSERHFQCPYCLHRFNCQSSCIRHTKYRCTLRPSDAQQAKSVIDLRKKSRNESIELERSDQIDIVFVKMDPQEDLIADSEVAESPSATTEAFNCSHCSETFESMDECKQHETDHAKRYDCRFCDKFFKASWNRTIHELSHSDQSYFQCPYCKKMFRCQSSCIRHTKRKCPLLPTDPKQFKKVIDIRKNASNQNDSHEVENAMKEVEMFKCFCCSKQFESKEESQKHEQMHEDPNKPFKCRFCDRFFRLSSNRSIHELTHISESFFKCPYCFKLFHSQSSGIRHAKKNCELRPTDPAQVKKVIDIRKEPISIDMELGNEEEDPFSSFEDNETFESLECVEQQSNYEYSDNNFDFNGKEEVFDENFEPFNEHSDDVKPILFVNDEIEN